MNVKLAKAVHIQFNPGTAPFSATKGATGKVIGLTVSGGQIFADIIWNRKDKRVNTQMDGGYFFTNLLPRANATHK